MAETGNATTVLANVTALANATAGIVATMANATVTNATIVNTTIVNATIVNATASFSPTTAVDGLAAVKVELDALTKNVNDAFIISNAIVVCLMQCGFVCLEAGSVRSKNVTNIIMKNLMDIFISALAYWLVGYAFAYGPDLFVGLIGGGYWAGAGVTDAMMAHWFFQFVFAATAATIVSGAVAERCHYIAYIVYSAVISGFVYPVVSHWAWSERGWLAAAGYRDFAGAGAVHFLAGICSLVGAALLGPRTGRFPPGGKRTGEELPGHSTPLVGVGGMILIAGFLAFNGGSLGRVAGAAGDGGMVARVMATTVMGGVGGSGVALLMGRVGLAGGGRRWPFAHTLNAAFAGMVSVCAAADALRAWAALAAGAGAGLLYFALSAGVAALRVDDPLDVVGVHLGGGLWGVLVAALLADGTGLAFAPAHDALQGLVHQLVGLGAIAAWSGAWSLLMFGLLRGLGVLRVSAEDELRGLDEAMHGEPGYPADGWAPQYPCYPLQHPPSRTTSAVSKLRALTEYRNAAFEDTERPSIRM